MKLKNILGLSLALSICCTIASQNSIEASNLDTYRNLLQKQTYTIKYIDITPNNRMTNTDKVYLYGKNGMDTSQSLFLAYKPTENVVVADGENRYEEIGAGAFKQCRLVRGDESYVFVKHDNGKGIDVYGNKKGSIMAGQVNNITIAMQGYGYGSDDMTRYLNAIIPNDKKSTDMPVFKYVGSGWLDNGFNYEDYSSRNGEVFEAVRYYFNGYNLVKIAAAKYWTNNKGVMEGTKTILKITEFSSIPDQQYLNLPENVKVKSTSKK